MSKNIKTVISDQLSVISKTLKRKEKKTAKIILLAIIFLLATEAQRHKVFFKSPKLIDISAPGSAAICSAAESSFLATHSTSSGQATFTENTEIKTQSIQQSQSNPLGVFSLASSGNFLASHEGTKAQRFLDADFADIRRGNYEA